MVRVKSKILRKILSVIIFLVSLYTIAIVFIALPQIDTTIQNLEEENAKEVLDKVVLLTNNVAKSLDDFKKESLERHKKELKNIIEVVHSMMKEAYIQARITPQERDDLKAELLRSISQIRYGNNNYLFAFDYNCTILAHPYMRPGTNMKNVLDIKNEPIVPKILKVARDKGEGYIRYWWYKSEHDPVPKEKLSYAKNCPEWKMVVGTGMYIDDIQVEVQRRKKELLEELKHIMRNAKIGKTGYIYIFDDEKMLIHPDEYLEGKNFKKYKSPGKNSYIYDDLVKAGHGSGVLYYKWDKPTDKGHYVYDKVSWVKYIPSMNLYVASSAYVCELKEVSQELHNKILYVAGGILLLSFLVSIYYIQKLLQPIDDLTQKANTIAEGNYEIRAEVKTDDEIGLLAKNFNIMVDRLQDQIENLDQKVKEKTEALETLAITDPLTSLYNRRYFSEISAELFELEKREKEPLSVMMLDIDKFKHINDTYGHQSGDRVIEKLASIMKSMKRESDIACRYGGEEFILLLPKTSKEGAFKLAQRIRKRVEECSLLIEEDGVLIHFTVSIGVSEVDFSQDKSIESAIKRADDAMYQAKHEGRNRTCIL